ncbi:hypothetical protein P5673_028230 [Acropora cervicornis]|uniref:Uncharacterized protein n=1 Tax=Acropora cervicornis TaxID=6130 RepID=A0AAD9PXR1_ACRCE|nr:hypothetical protein P5673_028230 [Acropora cervicornis]
MSKAKAKALFNDEETMLMKVRRNCVENIGDLLSNQEDVFLISNHERDKWDFVRLTLAILDALTRYQRETLTLSLGKAITRSSDKFFRGNTTRYERLKSVTEVFSGLV